MQLGITVPLQKHLKIRDLSYGATEDLFFCWDLHTIVYHGKSILVAVNSNNRFFLLMTDMKAADWNVMTRRFLEALQLGFSSAGYTNKQLDAYLQMAGPTVLTKTHGRKPVAGLNKAIYQLTNCFETIDANQQYQENHCKYVNSDFGSATGFENQGYIFEFLEADMKRVGIVGGTVLNLSKV